MTIAISGNNLFQTRRKLDEVISEFAKKHGDLAVEKFDAEEVEFQTILDAVQSLPFLAERKMVVVRDAGKNKELAEQIEQIISSKADSVDLILYDPLTDKRTAFYKTLKSKAQFEEYNELDTASLAKWLINEAKKLGGTLQYSDANYMIQRLGQNQQLLANELEKLITYDSKISRDNIDLLTEPTPQSRVFDLLDAAFGTDKQKALDLYADQRAQQVEPAAILAMVAWQLNLITLCKLAGDRQPSQIAKDAGLSPFPVTKASALAKKISCEQLKRLVHDAIEMDYSSKTKSYDLDEALKNFIVTV